MKKQKSFTLAEVLITLVVIGVIAAITIPIMQSNTNRQETIVALKDAYSDVSRAFALAKNDNGVISSWGVVNEGVLDYEKYQKMITPYFNFIKVCPGGQAPSCFTQTQYKLLDNTNWANGTAAMPAFSAITADGKMYEFELFSFCGEDTSERFGSLPANSTVCGSVFVDVNGSKKPNVLGKDVFSFYVTDNGVIPRGAASMEEGNAYGKHAKFSTSCSNPSTQQGFACAAWVLFNENMDYLSCNDLSWDGKHKCNE